MSADLKSLVMAEARAAGFDIARVTHPGALGDAGKRLDAFLAAGRHGDMTWMAEKVDRRRDPRVLWPEVRSIVMLGVSYAPTEDPLNILEQPGRGAISVYAQGRDYHDIVKRGLKRVARRLVTESPRADVKVFVDTAPLMEKPLAETAGVGWQGKHTNLVSREFGSWLFLGAVLTTAELAPDAAAEDHCGSCTRCLDVCPTKAFPAPYQLDARRCLAYLTIEHRGHIPREFRAPLGNRVFGCDDCLAVCPWNKFAAQSREIRFKARAETANPPLLELLDMDDAAFRKRFAGTPVKRTGRDRVVRNALIAAGNSGDRTLTASIAARLDDESPLVRAMAVWALAKIAEKAEITAHAARMRPREHDPHVLAEWEQAVG